MSIAHILIIFEKNVFVSILQVHTNFPEGFFILFIKVYWRDSQFSKKDIILLTFNLFIFKLKRKI